MSETKSIATPTPTRGVPFMLDGVERRLRFSLRTIRELKDKMGAKALEEGVSTDLLPELLWFGLRADDPELKVEEIEELVDLEHLTEIMDAISKATGMRSQLDKAKEEKEDPTLPTMDKPALVVGEIKPEVTPS